ncbi:four helix bundle protein [Prosthecochloris sp. SCSIO W1101]|uniref:four helix bundle protein n=1 Tax=Prosthecochloris sp. SCSIO W1101 TaxID=2992242 RepID=UPI00223CD519|nr:four helix bundle protein [Prosthecochloris sp. SCSIO W1101]UZJ41940.1 four helix bundle protein [Prosthecochloris sp. SCSIO W1101]
MLHERLDAWKESMRLVKKAIYELIQSFSQEERYGLTQQIRRAAVSILSNLAEGAARDGNKEHSCFINIR